MAAPGIVHGGSHQRDRVHARMPPEMPVLKLDDGRRKTLRNGVARRKTPLAVVCDAGSEELALGALDNGGVAHPFEQIPWQAKQPPRCEGGCHKPYPLLFCQRYSVTTAFPLALLAFTVASYMASQCTEGSV